MKNPNIELKNKIQQVKVRQYTRTLLAGNTRNSISLRFSYRSSPLYTSPRLPRSFYSSLAAGYRTAPCQLTDTALLTYRFARGRVTCSTPFFPVRISRLFVSRRSLCELMCVSQNQIPRISDAKIRGEMKEFGSK